MKNEIIFKPKQNGYNRIFFVNSVKEGVEKWKKEAGYTDEAFKELVKRCKEPDKNALYSLRYLGDNLRNLFYRVVDIFIETDSEFYQLNPIDIFDIKLDDSVNKIFDTGLSNVNIVDSFVMIKIFEYYLQHNKYIQAYDLKKRAYEKFKFLISPDNCRINEVNFISTIFEANILLKEEINKLAAFKKIRNEYCNLESSVKKVKIEELMKNKFLLKIVLEIKKYSNKYDKKFKVNRSYSSIVSLDLLENSNSLIGMLLDDIDRYAYLTYMNIDSFKNERERFVEIFSNYFYSEYGLGAKIAKLKKRMKAYSKMCDYLFGDSVSIVMETIEDLPDKIKDTFLYSIFDN